MNTTAIKVSFGATEIVTSAKSGRAPSTAHRIAVENGARNYEFFVLRGGEWKLAGHAEIRAFGWAHYYAD